MERREWESILEEEVYRIERGYYVNITFHPYSQKHFYKDDFKEYFPRYFGKVLSCNNKRLEDLLMKPKDKGSFYYINKVGTSGFTMISMYRPKNSDDIPEDFEKHHYDEILDVL